MRLRTALHDFHAGDRTAIELPAALGPVSFDMTTDRLAATWSSLPAYDAMALSRSSFSDRGVVTHGVNLSRAFVEATAAASATLDMTDIPGFQDAWRIEPAEGQLRALNAYRNSGLHDQVYSTTIETLPPPSGIDHAPWNTAAGVLAHLRRDPARLSDDPGAWLMTTASAARSTARATSGSPLRSTSSSRASPLQRSR